jgi:hypothetical protein
MDSLELRYQDAYRIADGAITLGNIIKLVGLVLGGLILLVGVIGASGFGGATVFLGSLIFAVVVAGGGFIAGVFLSAQGQMIRATLDIAVNTSSLRAVHQA